MKRTIASGSALILLALTTACQKQDTTNAIAENTLVSDEFTDGNDSQFGNSADGNLADPPAANANGL